MSSVEYRVYLNLLKYARGINYTQVSPELSEKDLQANLNFHVFEIIEFKEACIILTSTPGTLRLGELRHMLNSIRRKKDIVTIVSRNGMADRIYETISNEHNYTINSYLFDRFKIDVRRNVIVPPHFLCTKKETSQVLQDTNALITSFPAISAGDPQVIWLNGKKGQLVRIERPHVSGVELAYRVIV